MRAVDMEYAHRVLVNVSENKDAIGKLREEAACFILPSLRR
jgi:hypothetical protein